MKSRLVTKNGEREEKEEELQPQAFDDDLEALDSTGQELEHFRLLVIDGFTPMLRANSTMYGWAKDVVPRTRRRFFLFYCAQLGPRCVG
jgi:hypothetical protein